MPLTIQNEFAGTIRSWLHEDRRPFWATQYVGTEFKDFKRKRIGNKEYGFLHKSNPNTFVARYKCSWVEADRRFKMLLITRRMMK